MTASSSAEATPRGHADRKSLKFLSEAVQLLQSRPCQHRMHFTVYRKLLDELRTAVARPRARRHAEQLAATHLPIAEALEDLMLEAMIGRRAAECPELEALLKRLAGAAGCRRSSGA
jgi:hypothetical protein